MTLKKESVEDKWMKKVAAGKTDILKKGFMTCQACAHEVLATPNKDGKVYCPDCGSVIRGIIKK